jgi:hypothetical protein
MISTDFCVTYQGTYLLKPYIKNQHYYQQWTYMLGVSTQSSFFPFGKKSSNGNAASNFWRIFPFSQKELAKLLTTLFSMSQPVCILPTILMIPYKSVAS